MNPTSLARRAIVAATAAALLSAVGALAEPAEKINFCDELLITIASGAVVQHQVVVAPSGLIEIPEVGAHPAAGLAKRELATSIAGLLSEREPDAKVSVAIVRGDAPECSIIELPPTPLPEPAPVPSTELNTQTELEIELDLPDTFDTAP
jgi:protein involved in polysaccharide export with SLBB domain